MAKGSRGGKRAGGSDSKKLKQNENNSNTIGFVDNSKYAKQHQEVVDFVKKQTGLDLNKYRNGDGSSPFTTSYFDKTGPAVAVNTKAMSMADKNSLMNLTIAYNGRLKVEQGGGRVYSQKVKLDDVAWINGDEGQYAKITKNKK